MGKCSTFIRIEWHHKEERKNKDRVAMKKVQVAQTSVRPRHLGFMLYVVSQANREFA